MRIITTNQSSQKWHGKTIVKSIIIDDQTRQDLQLAASYTPFPFSWYGARPMKKGDQCRRDLIERAKQTEKKKRKPS